MGSKTILTTMGIMHRQILASRWSSMLGQRLHSKAHILDNGPQVLLKLSDCKLLINICKYFLNYSNSINSILRRLI